MKNRILNILRLQDGIVSGQRLSDDLCISRVSVWKHIQALRNAGYDIVSSSVGYQLINSPDALFPWEFPERMSMIHYFQEVTSTMDIARDMARKGCPEFTVVIAGRQTKGRGRLKRSWISDNGGIYFTIVIRPQISLILSPRLNFAASLCLTLTLRRMYDIDARLKWPNDILVGEKKIVGMLSEMESEADMVEFINIGIGINANNDPTYEQPNSSSLRQILGKPVVRKEILAGFLDDFESRIKKADFDTVISEWKKYTITLNRHVRVVTINETFEGTAEDIDENGALILRLSTGERKEIFYGDCFLKKE